MTADNRQININVKGNSDLGGIIGDVDKLRKLIADLVKGITGASGGLKDLAAAGAFKGITAGISEISKMTTGSLTADTMRSRVSGGLSAYKSHVIELDNEARSVKALGQAYREYQKSVVDAGRAYGYSNQQVIGLASMMSSTNGRAGAGRLTDDMRTAQGFSRAYGMNAMEGGSLLNQANRMGIVGKGGDVADMRQFAAMMSDAISAGGMQGREGEMVGAITSLTKQISSQQVGVNGTPLAAAALATMSATGIRGMQGEEGAALLGRLDQGIKTPGGGEAGNLFMYNALTGGKGGMNMADYSYLKEEGLAGQTPDGRTNLQATMEAINKMPVSGRYRLMAAQNLTGLSMHQYESMEGAFFKDGKFDTKKMGGLQNALGGDLQKVDPSVWGMLADLQNGGNVGDIGKEFNQLTGQTAAANKDDLFNQIKGYGTQNVALSEGQQREKLDNDIAKASEDAGAKLYGLQTAADELAKKFIELGGSLPGPLGGVAPIALGSLAGQAIGTGGKLLGGKAGALLGDLFKGPGAAAAAEAPVAGAPAAVPGAAAVGGGSLLSSAAAVAGGLTLGAAAAGVGSYIGQQALGTQAFLGEGHQAAIGQGMNNVASGQSGMADYANATGGMLMAAPGVVGGALYGAGNAALSAVGLGNGKDFGSTYRDAFFSIDSFDSTGRQQWQQQNSGGGGDWGAGGGGDAGDQATIDKLDTMLKGSGMQGKGASMLMFSRRYSVPVELALAQFAKESSFDSTGAAPRNNNPGNLKYTGSMGDDREGEGGFAHFPTLDAGIEAYFQTLGGKAFAGALQQGMQTGDWSSLAGQYSPGGNSKQDGAQIGAWAQQYHSALVGSSAGGWWDVPSDDMPTLLHRREMVLPQYLADPLRNMVNSQFSPKDAQAGAGMIKVAIEPIIIRMPDGSSQTVNASGSYVPFDGVQSSPLLGSR